MGFPWHSDSDFHARQVGASSGGFAAEINKITPPVTKMIGGVAVYEDIL